MKKISFALIVSLLFSIGLCGQETTNVQNIPSATIKTIDGKTINTSDFHNDGKPFAICFWATWCKPCLQELNTIAEVYEDWQEETGMKIYAVSIDDSRTGSKVLPLVNGSAWEYDVMRDENSEFKRLLGVNNPPHTFVVNGKGEIIWQHAGYAPGDEENLIAKIREELAKTDKE